MVSESGENPAVESPIHAQTSLVTISDAATSRPVLDAVARTRQPRWETHRELQAIINRGFCRPAAAGTGAATPIRLLNEYRVLLVPFWAAKYKLLANGARYAAPVTAASIGGVSRVAENWAKARPRDPRPATAISRMSRPRGGAMAAAARGRARVGSAPLSRPAECE